MRLGHQGGPGQLDSFGVRDGADQTQLDGFASGCAYTNSGTEMTASNWFRGENVLNGEPFGRLGLQMGAPSPRPTMADDFLDTPQCLCCYDAALDTGCFGHSCACCCGSSDELNPETSWPGDAEMEARHHVDGGYPAKECKKDCEKGDSRGGRHAKEGKTDAGAKEIPRRRHDRKDRQGFDGEGRWVLRRTSRPPRGRGGCCSPRWRRTKVQRPSSLAPVPRVASPSAAPGTRYAGSHANRSSA